MLYHPPWIKKGQKVIKDGVDWKITGYREKDGEMQLTIETHMEGTLYTEEVMWDKVEPVE